MHLLENKSINFNGFDWLRFFLQKRTVHRSGAPQDRLHVTIVRTSKAAGRGRAKEPVASSL